MHWACDRSQLDVVNVLINAGVNLHIAGKVNYAELSFVFSDRCLQFIGLSGRL